MNYRVPFFGEATTQSRFQTLCDISTPPFGVVGATQVPRHSLRVNMTTLFECTLRVLSLQGGFQAVYKTLNKECCAQLQSSLQGNDPKESLEQKEVASVCMENLVSNETVTSKRKV